MSTPKFNRIAQSFMQKINDPVDIVGGVILPGQIVRTQLDIENFVNKASLNVFNEGWIQSGGDVLKFLKVFPEMAIPKDIAIQYLGGLSVKIVGSPDLGDFKEILPSYRTSDNAYIALIDKMKFAETMTEKDPFMVFTTAAPGIIEYAGKIYYFPKDAAATGTFQITLNYIRLPINPDGSYIVSGQTNDTPFTDDWVDKIASEAERLFKIDAQQSS